MTDAVGIVGEIAAKPCKTLSVKSSKSLPTLFKTHIESADEMLAAQRKNAVKIFPAIGIHQYQGLFKVIPTNAYGFGEAFNVRYDLCWKRSAKLTYCQLQISNTFILMQKANSLNVSIYLTISMELIGWNLWMY